MILNLEELVDKKFEEIRKMIVDYSIGIQNVYNEIEKVRKNLDLMKSLKERTDKETIPIDEVELMLRIKSYPMNIKVNMKIETNFGEINYEFDYPPFNESKLSEVLYTLYYNHLNELYEEHKNRGGKFFAEEGWGNWVRNNEKTIINKKPLLMGDLKNALDDYQMDEKGNLIKKYDN